MKNIFLLLIISLTFCQALLSEAQVAFKRSSLEPTGQIVIVKLKSLPGITGNQRARQNILQNIFAASEYGSLFEGSSTLIETDLINSFKRKNRKSLSAANSLERFMYVRLNKNADKKLLDFLNSKEQVELAYIAPMPQALPRRDIPPQTPRFKGQGYLNAAPKGIGAKYANTQRGGTGTGIKVIDIEYQWTLGHEDYALSRNSFILNNRPAAPVPGGSKDHGSAVVGIISGIKNSYGVQGIAPNSTVLLSAPFNNEGIYSIPSAIVAAVSASNPGDVILIEQHYAGGTGNCRCTPCEHWIPVEYFLAEYEAIRAAVLSGRVVVEAAGNGAEDLDSPVYDGIFSPESPSSLALMIAAIKPSDRTGMCFSNAGSRIDLSAWGEKVVTTGYGDLFDPLMGRRGRKRQQYTRSFSGTSSASAIVAGAVAALQGFAAANGGVLTPAELLSLLSATGTATADVNNFGVMPDLRAAIEQLKIDRNI